MNTITLKTGEEIELDLGGGFKVKLQSGTPTGEADVDFPYLIITPQFRWWCDNWSDKVSLFVAPSGHG